MKLGIVVQLEFDTGTLHRCAGLVPHRHLCPGGGGIVLDDVDFGIVRRNAHHLLGPLVAAKYLGVHQHPPAGRRVEPSQVQHRLGLAGTQEMPPPVGPSLYPGMIVVGVRPTGRIDLTGRNAYRAQRTDQQRRFLATTSVGRLDSSHGRTGARVAGTIDGLLVTPVVDLQDGFAQRQRTYPIPQLLVEDHLRTVQHFAVHTSRQHEVAEQLFGNLLSPRHLLGSSPGGPHVHQMIVARIVGNISQGHVRIEELQGLAFVERQIRAPQHGKQFVLRQTCLFLHQVLRHPFAVSGICHKMGFTSSQQTGHATDSQHVKKSLHRIQVLV